MVARAAAEDLLDHDVEGLINLVFRRHCDGLLEFLKLFQALELHRLHREDSSRDMGFQVFFGNFGFNRTIEESVQELKFFFLSAFGDDRDEVDEFGVVNRAIQLTAVLDHEEYLIGKVGILDLQQFEVLEELALADHVVLREPLKLFLDLLQFFCRETFFSLCYSQCNLWVNDSVICLLGLLSESVLFALTVLGVHEERFDRRWHEIVSILAHHASLVVTHI